MILDIHPIVSFEYGLERNEEGLRAEPWDGPGVGPDEVGVRHEELHGLRGGGGAAGAADVPVGASQDVGEDLDRHVGIYHSMHDEYS